MKKITSLLIMCAIAVSCCSLAGAHSISDMTERRKPDDMLTSEAELTVYPADHADSVEIGTWLEFKVERGGKLLSYMDLTYEIVSGRDCAAVYFNGEILPLGEGEVVIKAFMDKEPSVLGYGKVTVVAPELQNKYTEFRQAEDLPETDEDFEKNTASKFPEGYGRQLRILHAKYPSWVFEPMNTGLDFWDAVAIESVGDRNLTLKPNISDSLKSRAKGDFDRETGEFINKDTGWVATNAVPVAYFMDPRNFLDERGIFQFESLLADEELHTQSGVEGILNGSFMADSDIVYLDSEGARQNTGKTYSQSIMDASEKTGVNPYYLAAKIRHEIGSTPSKSASGDCEGYEGLYNMYNIGATDGEGNIQRGLEWAGAEGGYNRPWTSPERSILGGAMYIAANYVGTGQETGYLQKWNVAPHTASTKFLHQYMTNVSGALSQAMTAYTGYAEIDMLDSPIVFSIPVYDNMPNEIGGAPSEIEIPDVNGFVGGEVYVRTGPSAAHEQTGVRLSAGDSVVIKRAVMTDAEYYMNWLFYPHWYEIEFEKDGQKGSGFVSELFAQPVAQTVLKIGERVNLTELFTREAKASGQLKFLSENRDIADVTVDGMLTAKSAGRTTVFGYTSDGTFCEYTAMVSDSVSDKQERAEAEQPEIAQEAA
ncbi:MAG: Ig-like domain-containing protein [Oscillospiraceae bacterium]